MSSGEWLRVLLCYSEDELFVVENMSVNHLSSMSENSCLFMFCSTILCFVVVCSEVWIFYYVLSGRTLNVYIFLNLHSGVTLLLVFFQYNYATISSFSLSATVVCSFR